MLRSAICLGVATKINTTIVDISKKRKFLAEEGLGIKAERKFEKLSLEEQAVPVRARQAFRSTKEGAMQLVNENGMELDYLAPFQDDKDVVLEAVTQNSWAIRQASKALQKDPDIIAATQPI